MNSFEDITLEQFKNTEFTLFENNPVIRPFDGSFVAADPSLLTPDEAPDGKWHMFFHTHFGVYHFVSPDGISFEKRAKITGRAMRPNINNIGGRYYLYFERTRNIAANALTLVDLCKWKSEIYLAESDDLISWSAPRRVIGKTRDYEEGERGLSISNPFLLRENGVNRLYYSCNLTYIKDCGFCEPTYISCAESERTDGGFISEEKPIISPDKNDPYLNLCSGCLKVYRLKDGYIGLQNGIFERNGKSESAIILLSSHDGKSFRFEKPFLEPCEAYGKSWMKQFVYASHLVRYGNELRVYFNARDTANAVKGRECIGFCRAYI